MDLLCDNPELRPFILSNVTLTGTRMGAGAYGSVEEVAISVCGAAKRIHDIFQDRSEIPDDEISRASTQFVKECKLMSTLRHPHIVQFLGVCFFPGSRLPALVMERLHTSLHDLLAPDTQPPPGMPRPLSFLKLSLKCSVLHNVASGLDYLHHQIPPIIHRDLSARNILLNSRLVAKLADLGVARIVPRTRDAATMIKAPGASVYMPPEAIEPSASNTEKSKYDASIDVFSLGVVTIFTLGETFPCDPLAPTYIDEDSGVLIARTELQRRSEYMRKVNTHLHACGQLCEDHPLIQLIQQCLNNSPRKRPNIRQVLDLLEEARASVRDDDSERNKVELVQALQNQPSSQNLVQLIDNLVTDNAELEQQLNTAEHIIMREQQQIRQLKTEKENDLAHAQQQLRQQELEFVRVQAKDRELVQGQQQWGQQEQTSKRQIEDLQRQLKSSRALVADLQKTLQQRDFELETLRQQSITQAAGSIVVPHSIPLSKQGKLTVQCYTKNLNSVPRGMLRGSATIDDEFAYFTPADSTAVYRYEWSTEEWKQLPSSPYFNSRLVITDGALTAVGGEVGSRRTNKLFTLQEDQWVEHYPPMNTKCSSAATAHISHGNYILVIGGYVGFGRWTARVELLHVRSRKWYELTKLPHALTRPSATICGNQLHVLGLDGDGYSCSLQALPSSDDPIRSQAISTWIPLPQQPVKNSTAATLNGRLVIVGGGSLWSPQKSIYQLVEEKWMKIGSMSLGRRWCLVVNSSPDKMMIVGGYGGGNTIEECVIE